MYTMYIQMTGVDPLIIRDEPIMLKLLMIALLELFYHYAWKISAYAQPWPKNVDGPFLIMHFRVSSNLMSAFNRSRGDDSLPVAEPASLSDTLDR